MHRGGPVGGVVVVVVVVVDKPVWPKGAVGIGGVWPKEGWYWRCLKGSNCLKGFEGWRIPRGGETS